MTDSTEVFLCGVEAAVRDTAESLHASLEHYWPTFGDTGAHERNISLHLAHAFLTRGHAVFGESHAEGSADARFDLVTISGDRKLIVIGECKQLYKAGSELAMLDDLRRLLAFRPLARHALHEATKVGVLAAFCWSQTYVDAFLQPEASGVGPPNLVTLRGQLPAASKVGALPLSDAHGKHPDDRTHRLHLAYAIVPLPG